MEKEDIKNLIKEIIERAGVSDTVNIQEDTLHPNVSTNCYRVEVSDPGLFTKKEGEALMALNHLVRRVLESKKENPEERPPEVTIDINDFQKNRIEGIRSMVHMMAERARYFKSSVEIDPMSAFDRRIVHELLSLEKDLETESQGEGRSRRVVIKYTGDL